VEGIRGMRFLDHTTDRAGRHTEFYEKFNIRHNIGMILEYTWNIPLHREAWKAAAAKVGAS